MVIRPFAQTARRYIKRSCRRHNYLKTTCLKPIPGQRAYHPLRTRHDLRARRPFRGVDDGALAALLKAPVDSAITGQGLIDGTIDSGTGTLKLDVGSNLTIQNSLKWDQEIFSMESTFRLSEWPALDNIIRAIGNDMSLSAQITRESRRFETALNTNEISAQATGTLPKDQYFPAQANITLTSKNPETLGFFPEGYSLGTTQISGLAKLKPLPAFDGNITSQAITSPWGTAAELSGPIRVRNTNSNSLSAAVDFEAKSVKLKQNL